MDIHASQKKATTDWKKTRYLSGTTPWFTSCTGVQTPTQAHQVGSSFAWIFATATAGEWPSASLWSDSLAFGLLVGRCLAGLRPARRAEGRLAQHSVKFSYMRWSTLAKLRGTLPSISDEG